MLAAIRMTLLAPEAQDRRCDCGERAGRHRRRERPRPCAWWQAAGLALAVLGASGAAGAFNHYYERDLDRLMRRTRGRPFASGAFSESPWWLGELSRAARCLARARLRRRPGPCAAAVRVPRRLHLRHRLYGLAEAAQHLEHRDRRPCRQLRRARRRCGGRSHRRRSCPSCSRSCCSCGRRRISGASPPPRATTMRAPACRCCRSSCRPMRGRSRSSPTRSRWSASRWSRSGSAKACSTGSAPAIGGAYFVCEERRALSRRRPRTTAMANFFASLAAARAAGRRRAARRRGGKLAMTGRARAKAFALARAR